MRLNIGCGTSPIPGCVNLDMEPGPGIDVVANIGTDRLPFDDDTFDEMLALHVIEHISDPHAAMQELYRVAKPDCEFLIATPYGSSDDAWEDPTHVRPYFVGSWGAFSQPYKWRAPYAGYTADWQPETVELQLPRERYERIAPGDAFEDIMTQRNVVVQMLATVRAVKPARANDRALLTQPTPRLTLVDPS